MSALSKTNRADEAWQYATLAQAAAITDLSGGINLKHEDSAKQQALQVARQKFEQVQVLRQALDSTRSAGNSATPSPRAALLEKIKAVAEAEYLNYIDQLKQQYKDLNTYFANQVDPSQFRNLHKRLPADMAMLMYVVHGRELMIFWATREKHGIITGALPEGFEYTAEQWLLALKNPQRPAGAGPLVLRTQIGKLPPRSKAAIDVQTGGHQLYTWLIEPVMPLISGKTHWCIIPNGKLSHLPFHAMGQKDSTGKFSYLASRHIIFYTNNPADLFMSWDRRDKSSFAAFGNPDKTLASAEDEVKNIAGLIKTAEVYTASEATVEKAMESLRNRQYVHFATHGVLKYPDFNNSYLVFAPDKASPNGGRLTLQDIQSLSIEGCDLVTLSACETAVSAEIGNGWYISPANAFLLNYVRSVVASLWEVDDKSTSLLMQQFYKHLLTLPKAAALRQAMADVSAIKEFEHPFYWAGFVLYGDWK
jgi:CHAT domain-containing protein